MYLTAKCLITYKHLKNETASYSGDAKDNRNQNLVCKCHNPEFL